jgi:histidyl-tRNA synthetase
MKKADRSTARFALILGDDECQANVIAVKPMAGEGDQVKVSIQEAVKLIKASQ